jgi:IclR family acetate operon transcriptional repressor
MKHPALTGAGSTKSAKNCQSSHTSELTAFPRRDSVSRVSSRRSLGETSAPYSIRAVDRVIDVLDALRGRPRGASLAQVAAAADLPRSSAFRYLATLEARGYVERDGTEGVYRLRSVFAARSRRDLAAVARPLLEELRHRFQETINLGVLDGNVVAYLEIVESPMAIRFAARPGDRNAIHSTALGKALAAQLRDEDVRWILAAEGMAPVTPRTITDEEEYLRDLASVRRRGFALDDGENEEGGGCVAVAVRGADVPAAISLSAPAARLSPDRIAEVAAALSTTAARLAEELERADA